MNKQKLKKWGAFGLTFLLVLMIAFAPIMQTGFVLSAVDESDMTQLNAPNTITIFFDVQLGDPLDPYQIQIDEGQEIGSLPIPTRFMFNFMGWFTLPNGPHLGGEEVTEHTVFNQDTILYAYWQFRTSFNVTFDAQGGLVNGVERYVMEVSPDQNGNLPVPTKADHIFVAWYTEPNAQGDRIGDGIYTDLFDDFTLYAAWDAIIPAEYFLVTIYRGDTGYHIAGHMVDVNISVPDGYGFDGWEVLDGIDEDDLESVGDNAWEFEMPNNPVNIVPRFIQLEFVINTCAWSNYSGLRRMGQRINLSYVSRASEGLVFARFEADNGLNIQYDNGQFFFIMPARDVYINAVFYDDEPNLNLFLLIITGGTGTGYHAAGAQVIFEILPPLGHTHDTFTLIGICNTDPQPYGTSDYLFHFYMPSSDLEIIVEFELANFGLVITTTNIVHYGGNRPTFGDLVRLYRATTDYPLPRQALRFVAIGTPNLVLSLSNCGEYFYFLMPAHDVVLTAVFSNVFLRVYFDLGFAGAPSPSSQMIREGSTITVIPQPARDAYDFLGWFYGDTLWDFANHTVLGAMTLTARWQETSYDNPPEYFFASVIGGTGTGYHRVGDDVLINKTIPYGYRYVDFEYQGITAFFINNGIIYRFVMPNNDVTITFIFERITIDIGNDINLGAGVIIDTDRSGNPPYRVGDRIYITYDPNYPPTDYIFARFETDDVQINRDADGNYYFYVPNRNITINAVFVPSYTNEWCDDEDDYIQVPTNLIFIRVNGATGTGYHVVGAEVVIVLIIPRGHEFERFALSNLPPAAIQQHADYDNAFYFVMLNQHYIFITAIYTLLDFDLNIPSDINYTNYTRDNDDDRNDDDATRYGDRIILPNTNLGGDTVLRYETDCDLVIHRCPENGYFYFFMPDRPLTLRPVLATHWFRVNLLVYGNTFLSHLRILQNSFITGMPDNPTRAGYTFIGWEWYNDGEWELWDFESQRLTNAIVGIDGYLTLRARWEGGGGNGGPGPIRLDLSGWIWWMIGGLGAGMLFMIIFLIATKNRGNRGRDDGDEEYA